METIVFLIGALVGLVAGRLWDMYLEEDIALMKSEAKHICDRLDNALTELRQVNAKLSQE